MYNLWPGLSMSQICKLWSDLNAKAGWRYPKTMMQETHEKLVGNQIRILNCYVNTWNFLHLPPDSGCRSCTSERSATPYAFLNTGSWWGKVHKPQVSQYLQTHGTWGSALEDSRPKELQLAGTSRTWQSSGGRMVQAKGVPEKPSLFSEHKEMATMKLSFRMKPKHLEVQTLGSAQRLQVQKKIK